MFLGDERKEWRSSPCARQRAQIGTRSRGRPTQGLVVGRIEAMPPADVSVGELLSGVESGHSGGRAKTAEIGLSGAESRHKEMAVRKRQGRNRQAECYDYAKIAG